MDASTAEPSILAWIVPWNPSGYCPTAETKRLGSLPSGERVTDVESPPVPIFTETSVGTGLSGALPSDAKNDATMAVACPFVREFRAASTFSDFTATYPRLPGKGNIAPPVGAGRLSMFCLLYTSDAADE